MAADLVRPGDLLFTELAYLLNSLYILIYIEYNLLYFNVYCATYLADE